MLGDQKQLKPRVNCYQLIEMNLDCSMFERLIKNKLEFVQLGKQCRMRDDIADLLRSLNIYTNLKTNDEVRHMSAPLERLVCMQLGINFLFFADRKPAITFHLIALDIVYFSWNTLNQKNGLKDPTVCRTSTKSTKSWRSLSIWWRTITALTISQCFVLTVARYILTLSADRGTFWAVDESKRRLEHHFWDCYGKN